MSTINYFMLSFTDSLGGHIVLVIYLLAIAKEHTPWKWLKKLPVLLLSPLTAALLNLGFSLLIPGLRPLPYCITSGTILFLCTLWIMWARKLDFWRALSTMCMAAILQVASSALAQILLLRFPPNTPMQYLALQCAFFPFVCAAAFLLKRIRFGASFQLLMENTPRLRQTALLLFALEVAVEAFFLLQRGLLPQYLTIYYILIVILVTLITGLVFHLAQRFDASRRLQAQQDMILQQQLHEQDLEDIRREVRAFRHDYKNLLAGLSQQARNGQLEELCQSLAKLDIGFDRHLGEKIQASTQISNLRIPQARSLLLSKLAFMREHGVECRLEVLYPVENVKMELWDFIRCLGILVDNAVEAALDTPAPWVEIILLQQKHSLILHVSNPYVYLPAPEKIWEEGWSGKGKGRGLGLSNYQYILNGYPNAVSSASWKDHIFLQELTIA